MKASMNALGQLIKTELRMFLREPVAVFFTLVFPFIPLLLFGTLFGATEADPGFRVIDVYVPALIAMVIAFLGLMGMPIALSQHREQGVLKRFRVSPVRLWMVLGAHCAVQLCLLVVVSVLIVVFADLIFGIKFMLHFPAFVSVALLGCLALFTLGFALVGLCSSPRTTQAVGSALFFLMLFSSGAAIPRRQFPPWLREATDYVPLSHLVDSLTTAWLGQDMSERTGSLLVLAALAVASFVVARMSFRWEP
ncbi:MAG TPA: ABC transporter permease [Thermoanaerobaculia bacterium]|nr:ABC transporter permease [Thermoanaerobaculia bacterium]